MRCLFYSHDGMGFGHVRRHVAIAAALHSLAPTTEILLTTSVDEVSNLGLPSNVDTLKLPGLRKVANDHYASRRLKIATSEILDLRSSLLEAAVRSFRPDVVLVDKHPLGASGEFRRALVAARELGARTVLGFRDILDDPSTVLREWSPARVENVIAGWYDLLLVYGLPSVFDTVRQYNLPPAIGRRTRYCGYVVNEPICELDCRSNCCWLPSEGRRVVLGVAGGGEDGTLILRTFIEAAAGAPWKSVAVSGPLMKEQDFQELQKLATACDVAFHRFIPCLPSAFSFVDGLVCMGGYNTLVEAVSSGTPTVCVPRVTPRLEQNLRSEAFGRLGLLRHLHPRELTPQKLRDEISIAVQTPRESLLNRAREVLTFEGAMRAATFMVGLSPAVRDIQHCRRESDPQPTLVSQ